MIASSLTDGSKHWVSSVVQVQRELYPMHTHWKMWFTPTDVNASHSNRVYWLLHNGAFNHSICLPSKDNSDES
jgi:hypothetical protein